MYKRADYTYGNRCVLGYKGALCNFCTAGWVGASPQPPRAAPQRSIAQQVPELLGSCSGVDSMDLRMSLFFKNKHVSVRYEGLRCRFHTCVPNDQRQREGSEISPAGFASFYAPIHGGNLFGTNDS